MRVFLSSLRCFFFAMRLRRFLMTEPIRPPPFYGLLADGHAIWSPDEGRLGTRPELDQRKQHCARAVSNVTRSGDTPERRPALESLSGNPVVVRIAIPGGHQKPLALRC
jgi:hypothetical protein